MPARGLLMLPRVTNHPTVGTVGPIPELRALCPWIAGPVPHACVYSTCQIVSPRRLDRRWEGLLWRLARVYTKIYLYSPTEVLSSTAVFGELAAVMMSTPYYSPPPLFKTRVAWSPTHNNDNLSADKVLLRVSSCQLMRSHLITGSSHVTCK